MFQSRLITASYRNIFVITCPLSKRFQNKKLAIMKLNGRVDLKDGSVELKREEQGGSMILNYGTQSEFQKLTSRLHVNH